MTRSAARLCDTLANLRCITGQYICTMQNEDIDKALAQQLEDEDPRAKWPAMKHGLLLKCPNCARAPLFRSYLKSVTHCESCLENWGAVRADDGPAWATMLIVGHVLAPFFHPLIFTSGLPGWAPALILCLAAAVLSLLILPRMKGLFIGLIWATRAPTSTEF